MGGLVCDTNDHGSSRSHGLWQIPAHLITTDAWEGSHITTSARSVTGKSHGGGTTDLSVKTASGCHRCKHLASACEYPAANQRCSPVRFFFGTWAITRHGSYKWSCGNWLCCSRLIYWFICCLYRQKKNQYGGEREGYVSVKTELAKTLSFFPELV